MQPPGSLTAPLTRREFAVQCSLARAGLAVLQKQELKATRQSALALAKNKERAQALDAALSLLGEIDFDGKDVYLKANFNSPDPFPATTHSDTLAGVVHYLRQRNCARVILVERSGMGRTRDVWQKLGVPDLAKRLNLSLVALDEIPSETWRHEELKNSHWKRGVEIPNLLRAETCVVQICNLKTHRFGGHFSASLKNTLGLIAKYSSQPPRYNYMAELHSSPDQRSMIAEVNQIYAPRLVVMDAIQVFVNGGPERGDLAYPEMIAASQDRVAIDAAGVALLRLHGAGPPLSRGTVFDQDQLKRAVELELGAKSVQEIQFLTSDDTGSRLAAQITASLETTPKDKKP
jgi:uncharacterized protein (DUF362 family)